MKIMKPRKTQTQNQYIVSKIKKKKQQQAKTYHPNFKKTSKQFSRETYKMY